MPVYENDHTDDDDDHLEFPSDSDSDTNSSTSDHSNVNQYSTPVQNAHNSQTHNPHVDNDHDNHDRHDRHERYDRHDLPTSRRTDGGYYDISADGYFPAASENDQNSGNLPFGMSLFSSGLAYADLYSLEQGFDRSPSEDEQAAEDSLRGIDLPQQCMFGYQIYISVYH
jgi:hypothetical protein